MNNAPVLQLQQRHTIDRRRLTRNAVVVHRIHAVRRNVHLKQMAATGQLVHAFHGNAAQRQVFGKLPV